jgi:acetyltransferase-like isoleucine patch superfamily enzyme
MKTHGNTYLSSSDLRALGCRVVGDDVRVHATCILVGLENLSFGNHVRVDGFCSVIAGEGSIRVGDYVHIGAYTLLSGAEGIDLADFSSLSHGVQIYTRDDDHSGRALTNPTVPRKYLDLTRGPVRLARHAVVGAGSIVLPGAEIGEGSVVGALSLVKSTLAPWGIHAGVPARRLRERTRDPLKLERELMADMR